MWQFIIRLVGLGPYLFPTAANTLITAGTQLKFLLPNGQTQWTTVLDTSGVALDTVPVTATNGPITLTNVIPTGSVVIQILPTINTTLPLATMSYNINRKISFALTYDYSTQASLGTSGVWNVVTSVTGIPPLTLNGTVTSPIVSVKYIPGGGSLTGLWQITAAGLDYVFESIASTEWFDDGSRAIDQSTGQAVSDSITILRTNQDRNNPLGYALRQNYNLTIGKIWFYEDGTVEPRRTRVYPTDSYGYGYPDVPDTYYTVVDDTVDYNQYLFWYTLGGNVFAYPYDSTNTSTSGLLIGYETDILMNADTTQAIGTEAFIAKSSVSSLLNNTFWTYTTVINGNTTSNVWVQDFSESWEYELGRGPNVVGTWVTSSGSQTPFGDELFFHWRHYAPSTSRIDPSITNVIDIFVLTYSYNVAVRQWIQAGAIVDLLPTPPTELDLRLAFASMENYRMFSDYIVWRPVSYKFLFGNAADPTVQANFKVVRLPNATLSDGEIKTQIINAINAYFDISLWDFGDTFYYTEMAAYIHQQLAGIIASIVIVPVNANGAFGDEFEIESGPDQILVSTATVANIQIINSNTPANLRIRS